jgi:hypothetical protein
MSMVFPASSRSRRSQGFKSGRLLFAKSLPLLFSSVHDHLSEVALASGVTLARCPGYHLFRVSHLFGVSFVRGLTTCLGIYSLVRGSLPVADSGDSFLTFPPLFRSPVPSIPPIAAASGANLFANSVFLLFTPLPFLSSFPVFPLPFPIPCPV